MNKEFKEVTDDKKPNKHRKPRKPKKGAKSKMKKKDKGNFVALNMNRKYKDNIRGLKFLKKHR